MNNYFLKINNDFQSYQFAGFPMNGFVLVKSNSYTFLHSNPTLNQLKYLVYINDILNLNPLTYQNIITFLNNPPQLQDSEITQPKQSYPIYTKTTRKKRIGTEFTQFTSTGIYNVINGKENQAIKFCSLQDLSGISLPPPLKEDQFNNIKHTSLFNKIQQFLSSNEI